ncbi:MAG: ABC transporter ATP-binding protein, partial [Pseudomonas sp.]
LLDEASVGLDPASRQALLSHVRQLCRDEDLSVLWTTHLLDEVQSDDALLVLHQGRIVADGEAGEIAGEKSLPDAFNALVGCVPRTTAPAEKPLGARSAPYESVPK